MSWRTFNGYLALACVVLLAGALVLWAAAVALDFIGNTRFIGHVSMGAIVLALLGALTGALAAWRADVPTE